MATDITSASNEFEWIQSFLSLDRTITEKDFDHARNFSLLWNVFEGMVCGRSASAAVLENAISELQKRTKIHIGNYGKFHNYITKRYTKNGEVNSRFHRLNWRSNEKIDNFKNANLFLMTFLENWKE